MSVSSSTDIANLALDLLSAGTVQNIETPTNATEEMLARWYDQCRKKVLREHPWNFAMKRAILAASSTAPAFGFTSAFPVPSDFIRLASIQDDQGYTVSKKSYTFEGGQILANSDAGTLRLKYIYDITDVNEFDPLFVDILALEIAMAIAYKTSATNDNITRVAQLYKARASVARAIDGQESPPERREVSRSIDARMYGATTNSHRIVF